MRRVTFALLCGLLFSFGTGCVAMNALQEYDWMGTKARFTEEQKLYTRLVRWSEFSRASEKVDPESRSAFMKDLRGLGEIRFTDYEVEAPDYDRIAQTATVHVTYYAYRPETLEAATFTEDQIWKRDLETGDWHVDHEGPPLIPAQGVSAR
jgi:hypothetical protein